MFSWQKLFSELCQPLRPSGGDAASDGCELRHQPIEQ